MNGSYQRFKKFITKLIVVNDCAERGVKLIQEFVDSSQDESLRQDIMTTEKHEQRIVLFNIHWNIN